MCHFKVDKGRILAFFLFSSMKFYVGVRYAAGFKTFLLYSCSFAYFKDIMIHLLVGNEAIILVIPPWIRRFSKYASPICKASLATHNREEKMDAVSESLEVPSQRPKIKSRQMRSLGCSKLFKAFFFR